MIQDIFNIGNVIRPAFLNRNIPSAVFCLRTRDRKILTCGKSLESAGSRLTFRCASTGVEIENKRKRRSAVARLLLSPSGAMAIELKSAA